MSKFNINLHETIYSLSDALDLVGVTHIHHGKHVAYMAAECGKQLGWSEHAIDELFQAAMLHDCGVSKTVVHSKLAQFEWENDNSHTRLGASLLMTSPLMAHLAPIVRHHHTHWRELHEMDMPRQVKLSANCIFMVDRVDVLILAYMTEQSNLLLGRESIRQKIFERRGDWFCPELVDAFMELSKSEAFWLSLETEQVGYIEESVMKIVFEQDRSPQALARVLAQLEGDAGVAGILILACDENGYTPSNLDGILQATRKPLFGGIFPQIVHGKEHHTSGFIALGLCGLPQVVLIEDISHPDRDFDELLTDVFPAIDAQAKTLFVFVDGFASRINALIDGLFNSFGLEINYLGGGCGSLSLQAKPCIISNKGLMQDGAVLALLDLPSGIGVAHGWKPISDAYKVTESSGNIIHTLDWQPAYQVYRDLVEAHSGQQFRSDHFFPIAKAYPFGITKLGAEMIVRDPLMKQGDSLVCVGEVPQGAYVRILNGDKNTLLAAAAQARVMAGSAIGQHPARIQICIDCISRVLFLEDQFHLELDALQDAALPMLGALTIGEIANSGRDYLEFYNKTAVLGLI